MYIPVRRVDNQAELEAITEKFSSRGIPKEILIDMGWICIFFQGNQAVLSQIGQINTTSYHLQTNGTLERWHEEKGDDGDALPSLRLSRDTFVPTPTQQAALIYRCSV